VTFTGMRENGVSEISASEHFPG